MSIYDTLNEQQKDAVFTTEGPVLVLAGAGSGKTRALTHRIAYLVDELGVSPYNIMAITFTNKAAGEMKERVASLVGPGAQSIWVSTFHSSCVRILRRYADLLGYDTNFTIYDDDDSKQVMKNVCKTLNIDTKQLKERTILNAISSAKNDLIDYQQFKIRNSGDYRMSKIADAYEEYQKLLISNNAMDFDDLIMNAVKLLEENPDVLDYYQKKFVYVMVDEYQDTNTAQFRLVRLLSGGYNNICVVGDDDQSIYKFRGANIRNILDFEEYYQNAKVIRLEQNYRSTQTILDAANAVIANNEGRKSKSLWTENGTGDRIHLRSFDTAYEEADFISRDICHKVKNNKAAYGDCAVLYRTNAQSRLIEEKLVYDGVPYNVVGGVNFYSRKEIKDILAYLKTIDNGRDDLCVKRIINVPKRGIGATSLAKVDTYAIAHYMNFLDALVSAKDIAGLGKTADKILGFVNLIAVLRAKAEVVDVPTLIREVLEATSYIQELEADTEDEAMARIDNIEELINKAKVFNEENENPTLSAFLEEVALVADIDNVSDDNDRVLLMTLHSAKGLEFEHVYLAGMEDGLFPSYMTITSDNPQDIEEERRLAYVGITRAKVDLTVSSARSRMMHGEMQYNAVSRFVKEIPKSLMDNTVYEPRNNKYEDDIILSDNGYKKPVAYLKQNNNIYSTKNQYKSVTGLSAKSDRGTVGGGLSALQSAGITKGMPVNQAQSTSKPDYDIGSRVRHIKFGDGTVVDIEPGAKDYKVTVDFDDSGTKIMYAAFAKLQKI